MRRLSVQVIKAPFCVVFVIVIFVFSIKLIFNYVLFPDPPENPPKGEPRIERSEHVFYDYTNKLRIPGEKLYYDGVEISLVCADSVYVRNTGDMPTYSSYYISAWLSNEYGKAFLLFFDKDDRYIGAIEVDDTKANPSPLSWGKCMAVPQ